MARLGFSLPLTCFIAVFCIRSTAQTDMRALLDSFAKEVRPLLVEHSLKCHGDRITKGGSRLTEGPGKVVKEILT